MAKDEKNPKVAGNAASIAAPNGAATPSAATTPAADPAADPATDVVPPDATPSPAAVIAPAAPMPPVATTPPAAAEATKAESKPKSVSLLRREYQDLVAKVQTTHSEGRKLEAKLLEEVKQKVKAAAGDLETLMAKKRAASIALKQAEDRETAAK